jgi:hypothetical protein
MNDTRTHGPVADLPSNVYRLADRIRLRNGLSRGPALPIPATPKPVVNWDSWYHEEALRPPDLPTLPKA